MPKKIAITTTTFAEYDKSPLELIKRSGMGIVANTLKRKLEKKETASLCKGCIGIIAGTEIYDKDVLKELTGLKVISRCGVGIENIDLKIAKSLNIKVVNTPYAPTQAVAELTVGIMLNLLRKISFSDRKIRQGEWKKPMGNLLKGKKVGIIGFGRIGRRVAELLSNFGCEIALTDFVEPKDKPLFKNLNLNYLLKWSDIVSIHASGNELIIGPKEIKMMKKGAWLINVGRGNFIDEGALYSALKSGKLGGAGLDVFEKEPYSGKLRELDNVVLTAHIGSYALESRIEMEIEAVKNLINKLNEVI